MKIHKSRLEEILREAYRAGSQDRRNGQYADGLNISTNYKLLEDRYIQTVKEVQE